MCESTRGEWGGTCPDCGQVLPPKPGPMTSWMAQRETENRWSYGARSTPVDQPVRRSRFGPEPGRLTERQCEIARIVAKHEGNMTAAAKELGITMPTVYVSMRRYHGLRGRSNREAERMAS